MPARGFNVKTVLIIIAVVTVIAIILIPGYGLWLAYKVGGVI